MPWLVLPLLILLPGGAVLLAGVAMLFFFLSSPRMYPTYPFTLRRYTPLANPVIAYTAASAADRVDNQGHGRVRRSPVPRRPAGLDRGRPLGPGAPQK